MIIWSTLSIKYTSIMVDLVNFCQSDVLKTVIVWRLCVGLIRSSEVDIKIDKNDILYSYYGRLRVGAGGRNSHELQY